MAPDCEEAENKPEELEKDCEAADVKSETNQS